MRIYYMGNFLPSHSTETHISKTLQKMGHQVTEIQENFTQPEHLAQRLNVEEFDLFLFTRTWGETLKMEHLEILKKRNIPSASYHLDLYVGLQRDGGINTDPFWRTDFVFTPDGDINSGRVFKRKGINHFYIKPGVFEDECYMVVEPMQKDVIFVGSYNYHPEWPYRPQLIDWLRNEYHERFELWGSHGLGEIRGDDLNRLYGRTKVVVGDSLHLPDHDYYWSDRATETLGRGGFLIHPNIRGMQEELKDAVHLRYYDYGNFKQLKYLIDYYIENGDEREKIRLAGHNYVKANNTYTQRLQQALDIINANTSPQKISENEVI